MQQVQAANAGRGRVPQVVASGGRSSQSQSQSPHIVAHQQQPPRPQQQHVAAPPPPTAFRHTMPPTDPAKERNPWKKDTSAEFLTADYPFLEKVEQLQAPFRLPHANRVSTQYVNFNIRPEMWDGCVHILPPLFLLALSHAFIEWYGGCFKFGCVSQARSLGSLRGSAHARQSYPMQSTIGPELFRLVVEQRSARIRCMAQTSPLSAIPGATFSASLNAIAAVFVVSYLLIPSPPSDRFS